MHQIQFFKGQKNKLNTTFLNNGSIYFIPEEKRLYIDTANKRIPITSGVEFYLHFLPNSW